ncbi:FBD-like protein [Tanacetum coccineum]
MLCKTTRLKTFQLHFSKIYVRNSTTVSKWISEAVRLNVSELDIQMTSNIGLPLSLFTCNTLSKLSLKLIHPFYNKFSWECPPSIYLPNLKTLDITDNFKRCDFNFNSISCDNIFKLIHGCPLLEDLSLKIHMPGNTEDFYFKAPTLKRLRLALLYYSSNDIHKVVLNLPNLEYLHIEESWFLCSLFVMEDLSSLVKAKVSCSVCYDHLRLELLKGLSKVRNLTLDITSSNGDAFKHFPKFPHVKKLVLVGREPFKLWKIPQILKSFCQLEHLCIKKVGFFSILFVLKQKEHEGAWREPKSFPTSTFKNIVTVKYTDNTKWLAHFEAVQFLKFLLENAVDLKKLIVSVISGNERRGGDVAHFFPDDTSSGISLTKTWTKFAIENFDGERSRQKVPENNLEVLKILENNLESLKVLENNLESLKLQENRRVNGLSIVYHGFKIDAILAKLHLCLHNNMQKLHAAPSS